MGDASRAEGGATVPAPPWRILLIVVVTVALLAPSVASDIPDRRCAVPAEVLAVIDTGKRLGLEACRASRSDYLARLGTLLHARATSRGGEPSPEESDRSRAAREAWASSRSILLAGEDPWIVPREPTWKENPFRNLTWRARFHSLEWLAPAAEAFRDGDADSGQDVRHYVLNWMTANPAAAPVTRVAWYDGAVWRRTNALLRYWDVLTGTLSAEELAVVLTSLHEHGVRLHEYLSDERFTGHNHNLFHALALHNLASEIPELVDADEWRSAAYERIETLAPEMLNPIDGVSTEQASAYHAVALNAFAGAAEYLHAQGTALSASTSALLEKATEFGALLPAPGGYLPGVGDTLYGASDTPMLEALRRLASLGVRSSTSEYVLSRGRDGDRPADAVFFEGEGYAIFRPSFGETGEWERDLHVVVDMGPTRRFHGHHDAMNVLMSVDGEQILADSGGPYKYGAAGREHFVRPAAHNTVIVDGISEARAGGDISWTMDAPHYSGISGSVRHQLGTHHRSVLVLKPSVVVVLDRVTASDAAEHRYDVLYHLDPQANTEIRSDGARIRVGRAAVEMTVADTAPAEAQLELSTGWVTPKMADREATTVIRHSSRAVDACFAAVIDSRRESDPPRVSLSEAGDGCDLTVRAGDRVWDVRYRDGSISAERR